VKAAGTRQLLLLAAADPTGDPALLWRAAARLGINRNTLHKKIQDYGLDAEP